MTDLLWNFIQMQLGLESSDVVGSERRSHKGFKKPGKIDKSYLTLQGIKQLY
jgi:hypothetical protein